MPTKHKLDIFDALGNISEKNNKYFKNLSVDEQKALQPLVVMRWMAGIEDARQIFFLNELVNPLVFPLTKHKELLVDLLSICGPGSRQRYKWKKVAGKKIPNSPTIVGVIKEYFKYNSSDAIEVISMLSDDTILSYAEQLGRQLPEIKLLKKELKSRNK